LEVYRFLKEIGDGFMQFIPVVERKPGKMAKTLGLNLDIPPSPENHPGHSAVTPWSVKPNRFGDFYTRIFDEWVRQDVGTVFVQFFDVALGQWLGTPPGICQFAPECGTTAVLEHNGDLYTCDHYVYPQYKLGNILEQSLHDLMYSERQRTFGRNKSKSLPDYCRRCDVRFACHGDCPKHRFTKTPEGEPGLSYLCPAYRRIFTHMEHYMRIMAQLVGSGRLAAEVMDIIPMEERDNALATAGRNDPCPCGSGRKYKKCCGA
jgi:uncharacterized protein